MPVRSLKETIRFERPVGTGHARAVVEGSITLPGGLREPARVLAKEGTVTVQRVEAMQDRAGVSGRVTFRALYTQGDPERVQAVEAASDFTHVMEVAGASAQSMCRVTARVERVETRTNGGQLSLKAVVLLDAEAVTEAPMEVLTGLTDMPGLEIAVGEVTMRRTAASGSDEVMLREEFDLAADLRVTETLFADAAARVDAVTGGAGRAGVSGEVTLTVYHASDNKEQPMVVTRHVLPFEQPVELAGGDGETLRAEAVVRDVAVASQDNGGDGRTLRVEVVLGLTAYADCTETMTILRDAYTTTGEALALTGEEAVCRVNDVQAHGEERGKALLQLPAGTGAMRTVLCAFAQPALTAAAQAGSRFAVEGEMTVTLVMLPADSGAPTSLTLIEPFRQSFAAQPGVGDEVRLSVSEVEASLLSGDRVELRYAMALDARGMRTAAVPVITDVRTVPPPEEEPGIVLYFVQPGETLWEVAKRYRVAVADIRRLNPEIGEEVHPGQAVVVWRRVETCVS